MSHASPAASRVSRVILRLSRCGFTISAWLLLVLLITGADTAKAAASMHWAFQPLSAAQPPEVAMDSAPSARGAIDRFIRHRLDAAGLHPAAPASPEVLIRRASFDLLGLPPSPEEVDAFVHDRSPQAYERLLDRLLASPRYGERWGRHWLDLARYAETDGFEHDAVRPHSWRYRDYVVRAFNEDKSFDVFIREQVAGDELWPDNPQALVATGFNLLGPDMVDSADQIQRRLNRLNDITDTVASVFLGLTFGCARCHDHKFEPFTQRDYFSLQAFFGPLEPHYDHPVPTPAERRAHESALASFQAIAEPELRSIRELEAPYRRTILESKLAKLSADAQLAHRTPSAQRTAEQEGTVRETIHQVSMSDAEVLAALSNEDARRRRELGAKLKGFAKPEPLPAAMVLQNASGPPPKTHVLARGDYAAPLEEVSPGFPSVLEGPSEARTRSGLSELPGGVPGLPEPNDARSAPRSALAAWIASSRNPLTARVLVNRLWQHHFGRGLVTTPNDFGMQGSPPSHPELLDWLASELIRGGWKLKRLHKLILLSETYQQSTHADAEALRKDPDNRLLSHQNRRRLEGEALRDSLLAISGRLNLRIGGPPTVPPLPAELAPSAKGWEVTPDRGEHARRSVYLFSRRNLRFPFLEAFDAPDSNLSCPQRGRSTTALQSLTLLNSDEVVEAARQTAERIQKEEVTEQRRVDRAYRLILSRPPTSREKELGQKFLASAPWSEFCRALFNLSSFAYVD